MLKIALVGAPNTGKSQLAAALTRALEVSAWHAVVVIAEAPALLAELVRYDLTLLMGLETLAKSPELARQQQAADQSIRAALTLSGVPYRVIYGQQQERLDQALREFERLLPAAEHRTPQNNGPGSKAKAWVWACDKCSDPQCEHRLLSDLLAQRARTA
ncbi:hypothetical protein LP417_00980 [Polaromonas sp. P1-6]|nr:hypothetical protein LP417_00980 [Polaromonas sp. P1-6]